MLERFREVACLQSAVSTLIIYKKKSSDLIETVKENSEISRWEIIDEGFHSLNGNRIKHLKTISSTRKVEYSVHAPFSSVNIAETNPDLRNKFIKILKQSLERAFKLEAKMCVIHPGRLSPFTYYFPEEARRAHLISLKALCKDAENLGIYLTLENMAGPYDLFRNVEDGIELLKDIENIGFCLDIGHANLTRSLDQFVKKLPQIRHIHIHDNTGKEDTHLPIGQGNVRWKNVIKQLNRIEYEGWLVAENYELSNALKTLEYLRINDNY